ncbi:hypothetical protein U9R90_18640 [Streptomyces sp. E11-3]|uniref:terpene synthase family protein n=1 Tax=Streptomyces sp. E11-3 TaxID=3110112 RepID=UPI0039806C29
MSTGTALTIPVFYCPIPPANRPDAQDVEQKALEWITEMGAYADGRRLDALAAAQAGIVIPQAMPHAFPDRLQIAADFMYWGFTFDDCHFEEGALGDRPGEAIEFLGTMSRVVEAPWAPLLPANPWARALRDLRRRVDACATYEQSQRWVCGMQTLFSGLAWETCHRGRGVCPDVDTYLMIRRGSIGMEPLTALNDLVDGYVLPGRPSCTGGRTWTTSVPLPARQPRLGRRITLQFESGSIRVLNLRTKSSWPLTSTWARSKPISTRR